MFFKSVVISFATGLVGDELSLASNSEPQHLHLIFLLFVTNLSIINKALNAKPIQPTDESDIFLNNENPKKGGDSREKSLRYIFRKKYGKNYF